MAIRIPGKSHLFGPVYLVVPGPGPAAELGTAKFIHHLLHLSLAVDHEGPVLYDRLGDGPSLQEEQLPLQ